MSTTREQVGADDSDDHLGAPSPVVLRDVQVGSRGVVTDLRIADGRIAALGDRAAPRPGDEVVRSTGHTVLPGLWDAHVHAVQWADARGRIDVSGTSSPREAAEAVAASQRLEAAPTMLVGYGFRDGLWGERPTKSILETVLPGVPVALISNDLHTVWLSPAALKLIGCDHATGVLREEEAFRAQKLFPSPSVEDRDRRLTREIESASARGVTGLMDFEYADNLGDWSRRHSTSPLAVRVACTVYPDYLEETIGKGLRTGMPLPHSDAMIEVGPLKVFVDGSLNTRTALCDEPYLPMNGAPDPCGILVTDKAELERLVAFADRNGLQTAAHAIGDRANKLALDVFERVGRGGRIEHAQLLDPDDIPRFARLGITAGVQPVHALGDRDVADVVWAGRTHRAFCYGPMVAAGVRIEIGSDAPVAPLDPWEGIAAAVSRTDGERPPWHPENAIGIDDALAAASRGRRTVRVGDPADIVLVGADPARLTPAELRVMPVLASMVAGRWTFRKADIGA